MDNSSDQRELELIHQATSGGKKATALLLVKYYDELVLHVDVEMPARMEASVGADDILNSAFVQVYRDISKARFDSFPQFKKPHNLVELIACFHDRSRRLVSRELERTLPATGGALKLRLATYGLDPREGETFRDVTVDSGDEVSVQVTPQRAVMPDWIVFN